MDFPQGVVLADYADTTFHSNSFPFWTENIADLATLNFAAAAWPAANRVIYVPFTLDEPGTLLRMGWQNGAAAGNSDLGIVDAVTLAKLCSIGATANAGTIQVGTPTGTTLFGPGNYYAAMTVSTVTTETVLSAAVPVQMLSMCGVCQDVNASATIPTAPSLTRVTSSYLPLIFLAFTTPV